MDCNLTYSELCRLAFLHIAEARLSDTQQEAIKTVLDVGVTADFDGAYRSLNNRPSIPDKIPSAPVGSSSYGLNHQRNSLELPAWVGINTFSESFSNKLVGIEQRAQVSVQADWNAASGDAMIRNKPTGSNSAAQASWTQGSSSSPSYIDNKPSLADWARTGMANPPPNLTNNIKATIAERLDLTNQDLYETALTGSDLDSLNDTQSRILQSTLQLSNQRVLLPLIDEGFAIIKPPGDSNYENGFQYLHFNVVSGKFYFLRALGHRSVSNRTIDVYNRQGKLLADEKINLTLQQSPWNYNTQGPIAFRMSPSELHIYYKKTDSITNVDIWNVSYDASSILRLGTFRFSRTTSYPDRQSIVRVLGPFDQWIYRDPYNPGNPNRFAQLEQSSQFTGKLQFYDSFDERGGFLVPGTGGLNAISFDRIDQPRWCFASSHSFVVCNLRSFLSFAEFPPVFSYPPNSSNANIRCIRFYNNRIYLLVERDNALQMMVYYYGPVGAVVSN